MRHHRATIGRVPEETLSFQVITGPLSGDRGTDGSTTAQSASNKHSPCLISSALQQQQPSLSQNARRTAMASTGRRVGSLTRALRQNREAGSLLRPNRDVHHVTPFSREKCAHAQPVTATTHRNRPRTRRWNGDSPRPPPVAPRNAEHTKGRSHRAPGSRQHAQLPPLPRRVHITRTSRTRAITS